MGADGAQGKKAFLSVDEIDPGVHVQGYGVQRIILRLAGVDDRRRLEQNIGREELVGERGRAGGGDTQRSQSQFREKGAAVKAGRGDGAGFRAMLRWYLFL